ncbi:lysM and putative peptidoglycan-binding domain-containing protein 3 [Crotalus adamanteus]|uniref:LysM and putative peptidoglycan-binding domain-containing protein 3 n=1 Tax=Crotalus adamanteus TaxID=8729 RepID=A0AAW1C247_CROAD
MPSRDFGDLTRNRRAEWPTCSGAEKRTLRKWPLLGRLISPGRMTGKSQTLSFQLPAVVQPTSVDSHVYPFGNNLSSDSDVLEDEVEIYELRPRGKEKTRRSASRERMDDIVFITKDIQEGDTLNALALQYSCSVADIKRAIPTCNRIPFQGKPAFPQPPSFRLTRYCSGKEPGGDHPISRVGLR